MASFFQIALAVLALAAAGVSIWLSLRLRSEFNHFSQL
jgi:hypothetical protein